MLAHLYPELFQPDKTIPYQPKPSKARPGLAEESLTYQKILTP